MKEIEQLWPWNMDTRKDEAGEDILVVTESNLNKVFKKLNEVIDELKRHALRAHHDSEPY
jgi:hypothetical protein